MHRVGEKRRLQQSSVSIGLPVEPPEKKIRVVPDQDEIEEGAFSNVKGIFQGALHSIVHVFNTVKSMFSSKEAPRSPVHESRTVLNSKDSTLTKEDSTGSFLSPKSRVVTSTPSTDNSPFLSLGESNIQKDKVSSAELPNDAYFNKGDGAPQARRSFPSISPTHRNLGVPNSPTTNIVGANSYLSKVSTDVPTPTPTWKMGSPIEQSGGKYNPALCQATGHTKELSHIRGLYSSLDSRPRTLYSSMDVGNSTSVSSSPLTKHIQGLYSTSPKEWQNSLLKNADYRHEISVHDGDTVLEVGSSCQLPPSTNKDHTCSASAHQRYENKSSSWREWMRNFKLDYKHSQAEQQAMMEAARAKLQLQQQKRIEQEDRIVAELRKGLAHTYVDSDEEEEDSSWGLSVQQQERVTMAITRGSEGECLSERYRIRVTRGDLRTLTGSMWLNDEVINFYFNLISECCKKEKGLRVHVFNSFFYSKLSQSGYGGVRRWTRKVNLFEHDLILLPVHLGMHWCLAVIDLKSREFLYYDSLLGTNPACLARLREYLKSESMDKRKVQLDLSDWQSHTPQNIPRQRNGSDCGVFTCMYARHKAWHIPFNNFSQDDMEDIRQHMIYEILEQTLI